MRILRTASPEELAELLRAPRRRDGGLLARWRQARRDRKVGRADHRQVLRAYYR